MGMGAEWENWQAIRKGGEGKVFSYLIWTSSLEIVYFVEKVKKKKILCFIFLYLSVSDR